MEWVLSDMLFQSLQEFTCKLYCSQPGTDNINELRYWLFCPKKGNIDSTQLPTCADCLIKHASRVNVQAGFWKRSLQRCQGTPTPIGWREDDHHFAIDWMNGDLARTACLARVQGHGNFLPAVAWQMVSSAQMCASYDCCRGHKCNN